ncbi:hypothetical protein AAGS40_23035 [Paraburkholderia sp. PREW-6R]|uniref:hypothetical protein n=1 Tax=Paraburkholderia sp. PREW-6R TaxID=3141544 RepID=UPI0031F57A49
MNTYTGCNFRRAIEVCPSLADKHGSAHVHKRKEMAEFPALHIEENRRHAVERRRRHDTADGPRIDPVDWLAAYMKRVPSAAASLIAGHAMGRRLVWTASSRRDRRDATVYRFASAKPTLSSREDATGKRTFSN